jgi:hypothetical protein
VIDWPGTVAVIGVCLAATTIIDTLVTRSPQKHVRVTLESGQIVEAWAASARECNQMIAGASEFLRRYNAASPDLSPLLGEPVDG